ncbi:hypothetical protein JCM3766R1_001728 [Sporobolomyces carnicolor]
MVPSPFQFGASVITKTLQKKKSWFSCDAGSFDDDQPRITAADPFVSLSLDPFARYTLPSRCERPAHSRDRLEFPRPPPCPPFKVADAFHYRRPPPPPTRTRDARSKGTRKDSRQVGGTALASTNGRYFRQGKFKSGPVDAEFAVGPLSCGGRGVRVNMSTLDELDEPAQEYSLPTIDDDDDDDGGTIFTLYGDATEWREFENALFFLKPSSPSKVESNSSSSCSTGRFDTTTPPPPSASVSSSSLSSLTTNPSSSASSVYSTETSIRDHSLNP